MCFLYCSFSSSDYQERFISLFSKMTKQGRHSLILDTLPRSAPHQLVEGHASAQNTDPLRSQKYNILTHTHSQTNSPQLSSNTPRHLLSELQRIQAHSLNRLRLCQCVDIGTDTHKHTHIELVVCVCLWVASRDRDKLQQQERQAELRLFIN